MPALFEYLLKANISLLLFCAGYYLVLRRLTFYGLNRVYLICAILFSAAYPLVDLSAFVQRHQQLVQPVAAVQQVIIVNWQVPVRAASQHGPVTDWWQLVRWVFLAGVGCMLVRLAVQLLGLYRLVRKAKAGTLYHYRVKTLDKDVNPFSFWQSIYLNPANHEPEQLKAILAHEQEHVTGWHTLDILLAELSLVVYWFNPGVWLIKKAVAENIEFITDRNILRQGIDCKTYQYSLLHVALTAGSPAMVNHFNLSKLKKRIIMMNSKNSSRLNLTRYVFVLPLAVGLLLCFTFSKASVAVKTRKAISKVNVLITSVTGLQIMPEHKKATAVTRLFNLQLAADTGKKNSKKLKDSAKLKVTDGKIYTLTGHNYQYFTADHAQHTVYLINGKKLSDEDVVHLEPNSIGSEELIAGKEIAGKVPGIDSADNVMIITSKNSAEGQAFRKSLNLPPAANLTYTVTGHPPVYSVARASYLIAGASPGASYTVTGHPLTYYNNNGSPVRSIRITSGAPVRDTVKITGNGSVSVSGRRNSSQVLVLSSDKDKVVINGNDFSTFNNPNNLLLVVDGKEVNTDILRSLKPESIGGLTVLDGKQGEKTYGKAAKKGVLQITTKTPDAARTISLNLQPFDTHVIQRNGADPVIVQGRPMVQGYSAVPGSTPGTMNNSITIRPTVSLRITPGQVSDRLFVLNGKITPTAEFSSLVPDEIESISLLNEKQATAIYGDKGKHGAIVVNTKKKNATGLNITPVTGESSKAAILKPLKNVDGIFNDKHSF